MSVSVMDSGPVEDVEASEENREAAEGKRKEEREENRERVLQRPRLGKGGRGLFVFCGEISSKFLIIRFPGNAPGYFLMLVGRGTPPHEKWLCFERDINNAIRVSLATA